MMGIRAEKRLWSVIYMMMTMWLVTNELYSGVNMEVKKKTGRRSVSSIWIELAIKHPT